MPSCEHAIVAIIAYTTTARSVVFHNVFHQKNLTQFITQNQIDTRSVQITPAQLRVGVNRSMQWNFNYRHPVTKNRINMALGSYQDGLLNAFRRIYLQLGNRMRR